MGEGGEGEGEVLAWGREGEGEGEVRGGKGVHERKERI